MTPSQIKLGITLPLLLLSGCAQVIVEKPDGTVYKINTFCYKVDIDEFIARDFQIKSYEGTPDKIKAITPYGALETK